MAARPARRTGVLWRKLLRSVPRLLMSAAFPSVVVPVQVMIEYAAVPVAEDPAPDDGTVPQARPLTRKERRAWAALVKQLR